MTLALLGCSVCWHAVFLMSSDLDPCLAVLLLLLLCAGVRSLCKLKLSGNSLTSLPDTLSGFGALSLLDLSGEHHCDAGHVM